MTGKEEKPKRGLIWERLEQTPREALPALSRERIVRAAMVIADAEGLPGITMRRVAAELGAGAMSLYRHVYSKEDLLDLMLDEGFGEIELPDRPSGRWQDDMRDLACQTRGALKRHPWLASLLSSRPPLGPNYIRHFEYALATLAGLGLDMPAMLRIYGLVYVYTLGFAGYEVAEEENTRQTGLSETDKHALVAPYVERLIASGRYPNFARFFAEITGEPQAGDGFEWGLDCLLDGLAAKLNLA